MENAASSKVTPLREGDGSYRAPPQNIEAEQALLAAILVNNAAYHRVSDFLLAEHFALGVHGRIYAAVTRLIERGQIANPVTLKGLFDQDEALAEIGGAQYLARLATSVVTIINAEDYGRTIHDLYVRRQLIAIGEDTVNCAYKHDLEDDAARQIEAAETKLFDLATTGQHEGSFQPFKMALTKAITLAEAAFKRAGRTTGVSTGFTDLDKLLGGLHPSDLVILAGRPSMGKTALATNIGFHAADSYRGAKAPDGRTIAEDGAVVGFFSLEMSAEQLATRILSEESAVGSDRIRRGDVSHGDFERFVQASQRLASVPFFIDDTPALTIGALRTRARRLMRQQGLGLIVVDYLQLLRGGDTENRVQEISEITRGLKALAKDLNVPVLALSQLSRAVEQREDKRPMLSDLRESGSIEQDADVVMFVFREEYYLARKEPTKIEHDDDRKFNEAYEKWANRLQEVHGTAEIIIGKQRHGPVGKVTLRFDGETTRFDNFAPGDRLPDVTR
ncbi:MAG TPA: replicative DNA helicase [Stellaceae bacterium]|jgi:replicative DNA helicase|nr:replicative DNA helicase [Stellaceae bacterium]